MISHKEFNVSKEIEFSNKNMFAYDVTGSCDVISDGSKIILFRSSNTKFSYSRKTVLQC